MGDDNLKLTYYQTATTSIRRNLIGDDASRVSLCIDKRLLPHVIGIVSQMADQFVDQDGEALCLELIEQAIALTPCQWGASLRLIDQDIEESQPVGPIPPWEFQLVDNFLEYRTKQE